MNAIGEGIFLFGLIFGIVILCIAFNGEPDIVDGVVNLLMAK